MTARELLYTVFPWEIAPGIPADELTAPARSNPTPFPKDEVPVEHWPVGS